MKRNKDYIMRAIAGETLLVPTGAAARDFSGLVTLNELGAFIWNHLDESASPEELVTRILAEYDVDAATARADTEEFLALLESRGMAEL